MPELRKRKAAEVGNPPVAAKKINAAPRSQASRNKVACVEANVPPPAIGDTIDLTSFGGDITTNDGESATLQSLIDESARGVIIFTYPKASTPGCTTQVCLFRDNYEDTKAAGFAVYGLSKDTPKANTTFQTKQSLPYPLLCDPKGSLISAIGMKKPPNGTIRGVFVLDKTAKVLALTPGGPEATLETVRSLLKTMPPAETKAQN